MSDVSAHHLLGKPNDGELVLLVGPNGDRLRDMATKSKIPLKDTRANASNESDVEMLRGIVDMSGMSALVIRCVPEVEGILDRSSFHPHHELAFAADRIVYAGPDGAILVWPQRDGTSMRIDGGRLQVRQKIDVVAEGEKVVGLVADRIG